MAKICSTCRPCRAIMSSPPAQCLSRPYEEFSRTKTLAAEDSCLGAEEASNPDCIQQRLMLGTVGASYWAGIGMGTHFGCCRNILRCSTAQSPARSMAYCVVPPFFVMLFSLRPQFGGGSRVFPAAIAREIINPSFSDALLAARQEPLFTVRAALMTSNTAYVKVMNLAMSHLLRPLSRFRQAFQADHE
jgi:hypothetical protein